jgi:hypothetical protein
MSPPDTPFRYVPKNLHCPHLHPHNSHSFDLQDDGSLTVTAVASVIDFATVSPPYDPATYYNATQVLNNENDNGIMVDMQKGFVALAMDVWNEEESDDVPATEAASDDVPATTVAASDDVPATTAAPERLLQDTDFLVGSNLTTNVVDVGTFHRFYSLHSFYPIS